MTHIIPPKTQPNKLSASAENKALRKQLITQAEQIKELKQPLDWFKRQLFGNKSEKRLEVDSSQQADLLVGLGVTPPSIEVPTEKISDERRKKQRNAKTVNNTGLRFDASVPMETIEVPNPALDGLPADQLEKISEKVTDRLAQRPGSYVILKYVRQVLKDKSTQCLHTAVMPLMNGMHKVAKRSLTHNVGHTHGVMKGF